MEGLLSKVKKIHLVGIGGIGMSGLAVLLKEKGFLVSGSDCRDSYKLNLLKNKGIRVLIGHKREYLDSDTGLLAYSSAVGKDNPEVLEAKRKGITILKRAELLAQLAKNEETIAIAGSHGKTTTTSLLSYLLTVLGYKPTVFLGGVSLNYLQAAWWGNGYFVIETDESDGSFLCYDPWVSIITNIDHEHLDYYETLQNLQQDFLKFAQQTKEKVFAWADQPYLSDIISQVQGCSFGWSEHNQIRGLNFRFDGNFSCFDLYIKGKFAVSVKTPLLGEHNCLNTMAAFAFFSYLGEDLNKVNQALEHFKGTKRRFQIKENFAGITFIDDYAHHPTEIKAVLSAARLLNPKRLFVIYEPHRFSRVKLLKKEFCDCFAGADSLIITDIYSANEKRIEGVSANELSKKISKKFSGKISYISKNRLPREVSTLLKDGDMVLALGAGDINILMEKVINECKKNRIKAGR